MDDFKLIKGIGPAIERRLHEVGITSFAQLAALSPDGLATLIDSVGGVSSERIAKQDWTGKAEALAATSMASAQAASEGRAEEEEGREIATVASPPDTTSATDAPDDLQLELDDASFEEILEDELAGEADSTRIRAEVGFRISGARAAKVVSRRPSYYVHILAEVAASDDMAVLAAVHGRLEPGVLSYRTAVEFTAPEVGHYQLLGTVVISDYNALGVTVGPKLKVIP